MKFAHPLALLALAALPWIWWVATLTGTRVERFRVAWRTATVLGLVMAAGGAADQGWPANLCRRHNTVSIDAKTCDSALPREESPNSAKLACKGRISRRRRAR